MRIRNYIGIIVLFFFLAGGLFLFGRGVKEAAPSLSPGVTSLLEKIGSVHGLSPDRLEQIRRIFKRSGWIGQGNPDVTGHPATPEECREKARRLSVSFENPEFERICGARYMAPLYNPETEKPQDAKACIDIFEFPDIPCEYPVVWVRAKEAAGICQAMGKRLCDAHEWEGACAGSLEDPDYRFDLARGVSASTAVRRMRKAHNQKYSKSKRWSYGPVYRKGVCGTSSSKTPGCDGGSYTKCGSNTFPSGYFTDCVSPLHVYDLNGNAAEHMNLPLDESEMAGRGSKKLGYTEMKGSWFVFDRVRAHEDWCRWRAPCWHGTRVLSDKSHRNYHLGFRCCKSLR